MTEKRVLITGASGLLGRAIYSYLTDSEFQAKYPLSSSQAAVSDFKCNVLGLCHSRVKGNLRKIDLNDFKQVDQLIDEFKVNFSLNNFH
jgi:FlaA1/EpsC-like NDP-sugar epimerase